MAIGRHHRRLGGTSDADTRQTVVQYFFAAPAEYLDVALHIEAIRRRGVLDSDSLATKASLKATSGAKLKKFHDAWYAPDDAVMVITGDVGTPAVLAKIKTLIGAISFKRLYPRGRQYIWNRTGRTMGSSIWTG